MRTVTFEIVISGEIPSDEKLAEILAWAVKLRYPDTDISVHTGGPLAHVFANRFNETWTREHENELLDKIEANRLSTVGSVTYPNPAEPLIEPDEPCPMTFAPMVFNAHKAGIHVDDPDDVMDEADKEMKEAMFPREYSAGTPRAGFGNLGNPIPDSVVRVLTEEEFEKHVEEEFWRNMGRVNKELYELALADLRESYDDDQRIWPKSAARRMAVFAEKYAAEIIAQRKATRLCGFCGIDLNKLAPEANIYPHQTGGCQANNKEAK